MSILLRFARQWIAGETAESGISRVKEENARGILGLLNLLGENIESKDHVETTVKEYLRLLDLIDQDHVKSQISIKPTQLGLKLDFDYCLSNYMKIVEACRSHNDNYLWVDMEDSPFTQRTIELYLRLLPRYPEIGIAIQSYLKRSEGDVKKLLPLGAKVRLVKGAYNEDPSIAFKSKQQVTENYGKLLTLLFTESNSENFTAVATHDGKMIEFSKSLSKENPNTKYEYEMLMGVRDNLKLDLIREGKQVREYVPYGPQWLAYSIRRIKEKKSNIFLLGRSLITQ
jgi:proline dehydrogenase